MRRALFFAATFAASSAAAADPRAVSLAEVIAAAAKAPAAAVPGYEIAAADADAAAAGAWAGPSVRLETNRLTARLVGGVTVPLPVFGTVGAARDEAAAKAVVVRRDATIEQRDLVRRALAAWIALARADAEVGVRGVSEQQAIALESMTRNKLSAGAGAEVDVTAAVAAHARATVAMSAGKREQAATAAELAAVLGWDPTAPLRTDGVLPEGDDASGAIAAHPLHAAAVARIAAAEATAARVKTGRIPALAAEVGISYHDPTTPGTDVLAGVTLDLPLFAHTGDQLRAANATTAAERARMAAGDAELAGALVAARGRWQAASETAKGLASDVAPAQEKATALAEQAYREGARDLSTALAAERELAAVRAELANAKVDVAAAWIELRLAAGGMP